MEESKLKLRRLEGENKMEEKLNMVKELVNSIKVPELIEKKTAWGTTYSYWKDSYSKARFKRQITDARAILMDLYKEV